jgi:mycothiol synthase
MAIAVRLVCRDEDYAAWRQVRLAVLPGERADSAEQLRAQAGPRHQFLLAEVDGVLAGSGVVSKSDLAGSGAVAARVLPHRRRQGVGTAILRVLAERAAGMGFETDRPPEGLPCEACGSPGACQPPDLRELRPGWAARASLGVQAG